MALKTIVIPLSIVFTRISAAAHINAKCGAYLSNYCNLQLTILLHLRQNVITFRTLLHLGSFITFRPSTDHSYTTNATMRQDGLKKFFRRGDRVAIVNKTPYMRLDLCCFSVTGSLPPCGSLKSTCPTHLWISPTLFIFLDKVTLEFLAMLSWDNNLHNLTAYNRMPVFENKRLNLQDIWRWILKKCYL